jgi:hypothetical protein
MSAARGTLGSRGRDVTCPICSPAELNRPAYAYLFGLYLGDGCLSFHRREVYRLRISLDVRQPLIVNECAAAMRVVASGRSVGFRAGRGCVEVGAYWKHWICLFPQHAPGRKHRRRIELQEWQEEVVQAAPDSLLRGLIHSDGCRVINRVGQRQYPRYFFTNLSTDIQRIFCRACEQLGLAWTRPSFKNISIARSSDVAKLDVFVGDKG